MSFCAASFAVCMLLFCNQMSAKSHCAKAKAASEGNHCLPCPRSRNNACCSFGVALQSTLTAWLGLTCFAVRAKLRRLTTCSRSVCAQLSICRPSQKRLVGVTPDTSLPHCVVTMARQNAELSGRISILCTCRGMHCKPVAYSQCHTQSSRLFDKRRVPALHAHQDYCSVTTAQNILG